MSLGGNDFFGIEKSGDNDEKCNFFTETDVNTITGKNLVLNYLARMELEIRAVGYTEAVVEVAQFFDNFCTKSGKKIADFYLNPVIKMILENQGHQGGTGRDGDVGVVHVEGRLDAEHTDARLDGDLTDRDGHVSEGGQGGVLEVAPGVPTGGQSPDQVAHDLRRPGSHGDQPVLYLRGEVHDGLLVRLDADGELPVAQVGLERLLEILDILPLRKDAQGRPHNSALER